MSPLLGIWASAKQANIGAYVPIATVTVGAGGSSLITFSSIPSTYTHLQLRYVATTNRATYNIDDLVMRFNDDTGTNYSTHRMQEYAIAPSTTVIAQNYSNTTAVYSGVATSTVSSNYFGTGIIDILDYTNTNKYKTMKSISGSNTGGAASGYAGIVSINSGNWRSNNAITKIAINGEYGNFQQYSTFALYGIKGS